MIASRTFLTAFMVVACLPLGILKADDETRQSADKAGVVADDFAELIKQLDAPQFAERRAASQALGEAGRDAMPALVEATESMNREAATRVVKILRNHFEHVAPLKEAARAALEKIAAGSNPVAARQAKEVLDPPKPPPVAPRRVFGAGQFRIQVRAVAGNGRRVRTTIINGVRTIDATENGRHAKIVDDPNNGIKIEITETKNGKKTTERFEAKNANDLKTKSPEAHKIYEQYSKQAPAIQLRARQLQPGRAIPIQHQKAMEKRLKEHREALQKALEQLERSRKLLEESQQNRDKAFKKAIEQIEQIEQARRRFDDRLKDADK